MAKVFLDANKVIDLIIRDPELSTTLTDHYLFASPLSVHILFYAARLKIPSSSIHDSLSTISYVNLDTTITDASLQGPTPDLEDNIQLHSAVKAKCDVFLTDDRKLLKFGYFGEVRLLSRLPA